ncbi:hypothetical protein [Devosia sp. 1566]|uniref:hypothetical protein n=1 Tax=Devosia sp. 1566 TaxID=2499144 RepID=UPI0019CFA9B5|nr:hypothetical protein [Devosia sp. 1566]
MMFLLRSMFWLCLAYMVIKPGADLARMGSDLSATAVAAGRQAASHGVAQITCTSLECAGGKALLSGALAASAPATPPTLAPAPPIADAVPLPRPRPRRS